MIRRPSVRIALVIGAAALCGCLGEPPMSDRWTNLEILSASEDGSDIVDLAGNESVQMRARITFREIITGAMVAELRASDTITNDMVELNPDEQKVGTAADVDYILANSVTAGRDFRSTTGFPDLVREYSFDVSSFVPLSTELPGPITGLFLVLYVGDEEEIRLEDGRDSIVITPYISSEYEILHKGIAIPLSLPAVP